MSHFHFLHLHSHRAKMARLVLMEPLERGVTLLVLHTACLGLAVSGLFYINHPGHYWTPRVYRSQG